MPRSTFCTLISIMQFYAFFFIGGFETHSQTYPHHIQIYTVSSGVITGNNIENSQLAYQERIDAGEGDWIQIHFINTTLNSGSFIEIYNPTDENIFTITGNRLIEGEYTTMHFNGHTVDVRLYIAPGDPGSTINIDYLIVSDPFVYSDDPVCLTDNRVAYVHNAIGRIHTPESIGTAWIASNGLIITAGHLFDNPSNRKGWIYFNVPNSTSEGGSQYPSAEKAYEFINIITYGGNSPESDYATLQVLPNTETGLYPADNSAQGTSINLTNEYLTNIPVKVAGYGEAAGPLNFTLQSSSGTYLRNNNPLEYTCFVIRGVSGGPVLKMDGKAMGVHSWLYCLTNREANVGTGFKDYGAWHYINQPYQFIDVRINQYLQGNVHKEKIGLFVGGETKFRNYTSGKIFKFIPGQNITLLSDTLVYAEQKFWQWEPVAFENHNGFTINSTITEITSQFDVISCNTEIKHAGAEVDGFSLNFNLHFKDPWYTQKTPEYLEGIYGYKNLGINAIFHNRTTPFKPRNFIQGGNNDIGSFYKGVFLNQFIESGSPYYSVQAISPQTFTLSQTGRAHTFYFQNWSANTIGGNPKAIFQNANSPSTGVVFKSDGAVVSANMKGTQLSSESNAFKPSGQNKIVRISNGRMYQVYESIRKRT